MRRFAMFLALGLTLVSCAGLGDETAREEGGFLYSDGGGEAAPAATVAAADDSSEPDVDLVSDGADRRVVRNASLQLQASDTREIFDKIVNLTETVGGFVASAQVLPVTTEDGQPDISMVLRVPADGLTDTMRAMKELADEVVSESQSAQDVSEQFVDLEARLTNLEALETELRALLTEVRAQPDADPAKLLTVFNELASVRGQIEQIEGELQYLSGLTAMATLNVSLTQTPAAVPVVEEPWAPAEAVREAARDLVAALQGIANWVIGFVIYTLPVLLLTLSLPALGGYLVYRRWLRTRGGPPTPAGPEPQPS